MTLKRTAKKDSLWTSAAARRLLKLAGNPPTVEDAVRVVAGRLLEGIPHPPTDLEALKPSLNLTGFYAEDMPISGELRRDGKGFKVIYSSYLSPERRRFTIAHEIGHAIFETSGPNCPRVGSELERLCDMLAAEILMPRDIFLQKAGDEPSLQKILELAKLFETSLSATALKYAELKRVTVFNVQDEAVTWGYGIVKKGILKAKEYGIRDAIEKSQSNGSGETIVYLNNPKWTGQWKLECVKLSNAKNTIFLLHPVYPTQIKSK